MPALVIIVLGIGLVYLIKKKKKENEKKKQWWYQFLPKIKNKKECSQIRFWLNVSKDVFFENHYQNSLKTNDVAQFVSALDAIESEIPQLKEKFEESVKKLCDVAQNNSIFIDTSEGRDAFAKEHGYFDKKDIQTKEIIKTLPILADFLTLYNTLYVPYEKSFYTVLMLNRQLYRVAKEDETCDKHEKYLECMKEDVWKGYDLIIDCAWEDMCERNPSFKDHQKQYFIEDAKEDEEAQIEWLNMWYDRLSEIGSKYDQLLIDLYNYFEKIEETYCPFPNNEGGWLRTFNLDLWNPTLTLARNQLNAEECNRILSLYTTGEKTGWYSYVADQDYKKEDET